MIGLTQINSHLEVWVMGGNVLGGVRRGKEEGQVLNYRMTAVCSNLLCGEDSEG